MLDKLFENQGFWNGEIALFTACKVKLLYDEENIGTWQNARVGEIVQCIEITYNDKTFVINNDDGHGYFKVTAAMGDTWCPHKPVSKYEFLGYISESEIILEIDDDLHYKNHEIEFSYMRKVVPEKFKKLDEMMEKFKVYGPSPSRKISPKGKKDGNGKR